MAIKIDGTGYIGSANNIYTDGSGNVGIGTSSPGSKFHIANGAMYLADPNNAVIYSPGSQGKFYIRSGTSGSYIDCMIIDSSGRITKPYQPMFRAYGSSNYSWTTGVVNNNTAPLNVGNNYNTSTYRFVAPVAGYYFFYAHLRYYNGTSGNYVRHMQWNIRRNAGAYETVDSTFYNNIGQNQHVTTYITTIMDMNVNDYADQYIEYISSSGTITPYGQVFVGYLLG